MFDFNPYAVFQVGLVIVLASLASGFFKRLKLPGFIGAILVGLFIGAAGEVPRIAGAFGLDTSTKANMMSAVYTAQAAVNTTRTVVQAVAPK